MIDSPVYWPVVPGIPPPAGAYSHVVATQGTILTCGLGPHHPLTGAVADGIEAQTEQVIENLATLLRGVGATLADVVQLRAYLADLHRDFGVYNTVLERLLPRPFPVRTTVGTQLLGFLVEVEVVAVPAPVAHL
jgi:enamine deaminase RidA (YjgF/YER057c/UK114 family)